MSSCSPIRVNHNQDSSTSSSGFGNTSSSDANATIDISKTVCATDKNQTLTTKQGTKENMQGFSPLYFGALNDRGYLESYAYLRLADSTGGIDGKWMNVTQAGQRLVVDGQVVSQSSLTLKEDEDNFVYAAIQNEPYGAKSIGKALIGKSYALQRGTDGSITIPDSIPLTKELREETEEAIRRIAWYGPSFGMNLTNIDRLYDLSEYEACFARYSNGTQRLDHRNPPDMVVSSSLADEILKTDGAKNVGSKGPSSDPSNLKTGSKFQ